MSKPPKNQTVSFWDSLKSFENLPNATKFIEETSRGFKAESVQQTSDRYDLDKPRLVTVKRLAALYGLTINSIYTLIKTDLSFPYKNLGVKKRFLVDLAEFEKWMANRTTSERDRALNIPKATDLIKRYKK